MVYYFSEWFFGYFLPKSRGVWSYCQRIFFDFTKEKGLFWAKTILFLWVLLYVNRLSYVFQKIDPLLSQFLIFLPGHSYFCRHCHILCRLALLCHVCFDLFFRWHYTERSFSCSDQGSCCVGISKKLCQIIFCQILNSML